MGKLDGRIALITGAASGIGAACARSFAEEGATIAGVDLQKPIDDSWNTVTAKAPRSTFRDGVDVRSEESVAACVNAIAEEHGKIDILVNAAGVGGGGPTHDLDVAEFDRIVDINLKGSFLVSKHALKRMLTQGSGNIVHLASVEGLEGMTSSLPYNASKGGVVLMTKSMAVDYGHLGIRVNCLCPGLIDTPLTALLKLDALKGVRDAMERWHLLGRAGRPEEVAACALFLASDDSSFVHGHSLVVDGGWMAGRRIDPSALPDVDGGWGD